MAEIEGAIQYEDCYATWSHEALAVGNDLVERRWRLASTGLEPISYFDKATGYQWIKEPLGASPSIAGCGPVTHFAVTASAGKRTAVARPSLNVAVVAESDHPATYLISVFPGLASVVVSAEAAARMEPSAASGAAGDAAPTGVELADSARTSDVGTDTVDAYSFAGQHYRLRHFTFLDQTDHHNELVQESEYRLHTNEVGLRLSGNLFVIEDVLTGAGIAYLKLTALPYVRPIQERFDIEVDRGARLRVVGFGLGDSGRDGYRTASLVYNGGRQGLTSALQSLQLALRLYEVGRDGQFLSNTWGDRGQDSRIAEAFLQTEVAAGNRLGVDVVQIDDGWQTGRTANSALSKGGVWEGFRAQEAFWAVDPAKFPRGLEPLLEAQAASGQRLGLWFAPDSAHDFANWRADADTLLELHHRYGIDFFKLDGIKIRTAAGQQNLYRFLNAVREDSLGKVACDLDVTAETRPGYFGAIESGPVFVENRYTDWGGYWPHATLRNIWKLAHYIAPVRLRMEMLNNERNRDKYGDDPLAPEAYEPAYLFAITMVASPLGWFEMSGLSDRYVQSVSPLVALWKQHRARLHDGAVFPVGNAPDGTAWTGFVSRPADGNGGYAIIFRERNGHNRHTFNLEGLVDASSAHLLAGDAVVSLTRDLLTVTLPEPLSFAFVQLHG